MNHRSQDTIRTSGSSSINGPVVVRRWRQHGLSTGRLLGQLERAKVYSSQT